MESWTVNSHVEIVRVKQKQAALASVRAQCGAERKMKADDAGN